jgi:hypothetical protein
VSETAKLLHPKSLGATFTVGRWGSTAVGLEIPPPNEDEEIADMRIRRRSAVIAIVASALAIGGIAYVVTASAALRCSGPLGTDNRSCLDASFTPNTGLSATTRTPGQLFVHTHSDYAHPGDKAHGGFAHKVELFFDSDGTIDPSATPHKCTEAMVANKDPHDALVACGPLGNNDSWLLPPTATTFNGTTTTTGGLKGCTLQFNGKPTATGNPTVVLYARIWLSNFVGCGNPKTTTAPGTTVTLSGVITNASAPYGKKLTVDNIDNLPLALDDYTAKVKRGSYVSSKCSGHNGLLNGSKYWKLKARVTYSGGSTNGQPPDTVVITQKCSN